MPITPIRLIAILIGAAIAPVASAQEAPPSQPEPKQPDANQPDHPSHDAHLKNPDGSWKYTNHLAGETSPYLLQHAHNPVDWYPWGDEAFEAARESGKPILLSVGYSTCYWCHVMEREVFSDVDIAEAMNDAFVNIKLDREERPDLDQIYMLATQLMTGSGGWPNNVFLTHDLKPFFGGTYFGPENVLNPDGSLARPGFPLIIEGITNVWRNDRAMVDDTVTRLHEAIQTYLTDEPPADPPEITFDLVATALADHAQHYDPRFGGFGIQPKFPNGYHYALLLDEAERAGDAATRDMALTTLRNIARAGIHDHVGGGFHRYATDQQWNVPHFEKMLYNQGQLALAFALAFEKTDDPAFKHAATRAFDFVERELTSPHGAFYSAIDAEVDAVEGQSYVWTHERAAEILDEPAFALLQRLFTLTPVQEFPGHPLPDGQVLHLEGTHQALADELGVTTDELIAKIAPILDALLEARERRPQPRLDDKVITAWNAIMIDALARAGMIFDDDDLIARAERAATFIHGEMTTTDGTLARIWRDDEAAGEAFLEDSALLARAYLALSRALEEEADGLWLERALDLRDKIDQRFLDQADSAYFFAEAGPDLIARSKSAADGAIPSGNSAMAHLLLDMAEDDRIDAKRRATAMAQSRRILGRFAAAMQGQPGAYMNLLHAAHRWAAMQPGASNEEPEERPEPGAEPGPTDSTARVDFTASAPPTVKPGQRFDVTLTLDIDDGWHVSATPPSLQFLIPTRVDVRPAGDAPDAEPKFEVLDIAYPEGEEIGLAGETIRAYASGDQITVSCRAARDAPVGEASLRVVASFQACDDSVCLQPGRLAKTLRLVIVE